MTIILKSEAGGRRWQHFAHNGDNGAMGQHGNGAQQAGDTLQRTERNYTVILGSHRNSCIKIEKDGQLCDRVSAGCAWSQKQMSSGMANGQQMHTNASICHAASQQSL